MLGYTNPHDAVARHVDEDDLGKREVIDSAALGMLLLARERAGEQGKTVALANCRGPVKAVLDIANFQRLFAIS